MTEVELTTEASEVLARARRAEERYVIALLAAAGHPVSSAVRDAVDAGPPLVERRGDGSVRLHETVEQAEAAVLAAAARRAGGPVAVSDLTEAVMRIDHRLKAVADAGLSRASSPHLLDVDDGLRDLVAEAPHSVAGRRRELVALMMRLARGDRPGAVLVGPPRAGRRSVVLRLANLLAGGQASPRPPQTLRQSRIIELEAASLSATVRHIDFREVAEVGDIILVRTGDPAWLRATVEADVLAALRLVLRMTPERYEASCQSADGGFSDLGAPIEVGPPPDEAVPGMVDARLADLQRRHGVGIDAPALDLLLSWALEHQLSPQPAATVEVLDECLATAETEVAGVEQVMHVLAASGRCTRAELDRWYFNKHWCLDAGRCPNENRRSDASDDSSPAQEQGAAN